MSRPTATKRRRPRTSWPTCPISGKVRLGERKDAKLALADIARHRARHVLADVPSARRECRAYRCPDCRGWHLTSRPGHSS